MQEATKGKRVLVVGHADADGHLAAEQSRRNVLKLGAKSCSVFVDPGVTKNYRFWDRHLPNFDFGEAETIIFVDIMLNPKTLKKSFACLIEKVLKEKHRQFILIDHHPLGGLPGIPENLKICFTPIVYTCCYGPPSDIMIVASICDRDEKPIQEMITFTHRHRAKGVRRAAADTKELAGAPLLRLLSLDRWDIIESLADENDDMHRTVRGMRLLRLPSSDALHAARVAAG